MIRRLSAVALGLTLALSTSCQSGIRLNQRAPLVVHPAYSASFEALTATLEDENMDVARATLRQLRSRLAADLALVPTLAEARGRADDVAARTLAGELPSKENVRAAMEIADGFERIVDGRTRLAAVELSVALERRTGEEMIDVYLVGVSSWPEPLTVLPSAASLVLQRTSLEPHTGQERRESSVFGLDEAPRLDIPARGEARLHVAELPIQVPIGAIATRVRANLTFNGGSVEEDGTSFPARTIEASIGERTDLAGWVPATLVDPAELVRLVDRGGAPLTAILERTVRIAPDRRDEALDGLSAVLEMKPVDTAEQVVPAVRWLVGAQRFGRDGAMWRDWLFERLDERRAAGIIE